MMFNMYATTAARKETQCHEDHGRHTTGSCFLMAAQIKKAGGSMPIQRSHNLNMFLLWCGLLRCHEDHVRHPTDGHTSFDSSGSPEEENRSEDDV
jgi:hypothetical protein